MRAFRDADLPELAMFVVALGLAAIAIGTGIGIATEEPNELDAIECRRMCEPFRVERFAVRTDSTAPECVCSEVRR